MKKICLVLVVTLVINSSSSGQNSKGKDYLILVSDSASGSYGYRSKTGEIVIPLGRYMTCYTDTFRNYAIVEDSANGIIGIDRQGKILYNVFIFDNGPDYPSDGLFRIRIAGKIGYAYASNGKIAVKPQFACAWPFEQGIAKVAMKCETHFMGEHSTWTSNDWFYINKTGARVKR